MLRSLIQEPPPPREVLLEGPAGTGKTRGILEGDHFLCERVPGLRVLWTRDVRSHLTETVMRTFEDLVLPPGHSLLTGAKRSHRKQYEYDNGSRIVCSGFNRPDEFRSSEYHLIRVFEAAEVSIDNYEKVMSRMGRDTVLSVEKLAYINAGNDARNYKSTGKERAVSQIICDTNPDAPGHWLNLRADGQQMRRYTTTHKDNPAYWDHRACDWTELGRDYVGRTLHALTGVRRARYLDGRWCAAEGAIWPEFSRGKHIVERLPQMEAYIAGIDWGFRGAGCLHVYGLDKAGALYLVREHYRRQVNQGEWTSIARGIVEEFSPSVWVGDSADPGAIDMFRKSGLPMRGAFKSVAIGLSLVRQRLAEGRLYFYRDANQNIDPGLAMEKRPTSVIGEIESYVYAAHKDGRPLKEEPDPGCIDHGCDTLRYCVAYFDHKNPNIPAGPEVGEKYPVGTLGNLMGHDILEGGEDD